jgi:hypothetical protein
MDTRIGPNQPDLVTVSSEPRPTPSKTKFSEVLATGTTSVVEGAEAAMTVLPGSPMTALAVRGPLPAPPLAPGLPTPPLGLTPGLPGALPMPIGGPAIPGLGAPMGGAAAEGPGAIAPSPGAAIGTALAAGLPGALMGEGGLQASLLQSQQMNMLYLQLQQEVDAENRVFSTLSNVLKAQNDTVKNAIGNIH